MSQRYRPLDLSQVRTVPLATRANKAALSDLAQPPCPGLSFRDFFAGLPRQLGAEELRRVVGAVADAYRREQPVIWGIGAHVIKVGLSGVLIDLMERGLVSCLAMNGAGAIHDVEIALVGGTSEDVAAGLADGSFGMAAETGASFAEALGQAEADGAPGLGQLLGCWLVKGEAPHRDRSLLARAAELDVPTTVHVAIGTDIVHMHPGIDGALLGATTYADFRRFAGVVAELSGGGVYLNVGSAVLLPEVFLKAVTVARNLGRDCFGFTTVNMDMQQHYRPLQNVVRRPTADGGAGITLTGHHEIMVPLLVQAIVEELAQP